MIEGLTVAETGWLSSFFAAPNDLSWDSLVSRSAPLKIIERIEPWLEMLNETASEAPIILPMFRGSDIIGWYATTRGTDGGYELGAEIEAWLGPAYLSVFETVPPTAGD